MAGILLALTLVFTVLFYFILLNYNFNHIFLFFRNNDSLIKLGVFLIFFKTITNFLNLLNI